MSLLILRGILIRNSIAFISYNLAEFSDCPPCSLFFFSPGPKPVTAPMTTTTQTKGSQPQPSHSDATNSIFSHCQAGTVNSHTSNLSGGLDTLINDKSSSSEKQINPSDSNQAQGLAGIGSWAESTPALEAPSGDLILD